MDDDDDNRVSSFFHVMGVVGGLSAKQQQVYNREQRRKNNQRRRLNGRGHGFFGGDKMPQWIADPSLDWWQNSTYTARNFPDVRNLIRDEENSDDEDNGPPVILQHKMNPYHHKDGRVLKNGQPEYLEPPMLLTGSRQIHDGELPSRPGSVGSPQLDLLVPATNIKRPRTHGNQGLSRNKGNPHRICEEPPFLLVTPRAWLIWTIGVCITMFLIFVLECIGGGFSVDFNPPRFGPDMSTILSMGGRYGPLLEQGEFWRFGTCLFIHSGLVQYILCVILHSLSWHFEGEWGFWKTLTVWIITGIYGSMLSSVALPMEIKCGSSAAVFGWVGIELIDVISEWRKSYKPVLTLLMNFLIIVIGVVGGLFYFLDNWSHIGGFVFGVLISLILLPNINFGRCDWVCKGILAFVSFPLLAIIFILTAIAFYEVVNVNTKHCTWCYKVNCWNVTGWCRY